MATAVLFVCTGNSARSILAEALLNRLGEGEFQAYSAGSSPVGQINPGAQRLLQRYGYDPAAFRSKSWDEFAGEAAMAMDLIVTVCDSAAGEVCPVWPGHPMTTHWGLPDPAAADGDDAAVDAAFESAYATLQARIKAFLDLDRSSLANDAMRLELSRIGKLAHAG